MKNIKINAEKIEAAIADFEKAVDFELVPVIAHSSTTTKHLKWLLSVIFMVVSLIGLETFLLTSWHNWDAQDVFKCVATLFIISIGLGFLLARIPWLKRIAISAKDRHQIVQTKAEQVFLRKRLFATHAHQGLLLFISLKEHRIVVLPDFRSNFDGAQKLTEDVLKILQDDFKSGDYEKGLLEAIEYLKTTLAPKFPKKSDASNENQLSNKLIWWNE
jgi:putative membrane protein